MTADTCFHYLRLHLVLARSFPRTTSLGTGVDDKQCTAFVSHQHRHKARRGHELRLQLAIPVECRGFLNESVVAHAPIDWVIDFFLFLSSVALTLLVPRIDGFTVIAAVILVVPLSRVLTTPRCVTIAMELRELDHENEPSPPVTCKGNSYLARVLLSHATMITGGEIRILS